MTKKKNLFVFTKLFPFGNAEHYLMDELPFLCDKFDKVVLVPAEVFESNKYIARNLPLNCEVLLLNEAAGLVKSSKNYVELFKVFLGEWIRCRSKNWFWNERKRYLGVLKHQSHLASVLSEILSKRFGNDDNRFYCYWIHNSAIMLGLMKGRRCIDDFICRGHSIDLYEWDWALVRYIKILPFYNFIIRKAGQIVSISKHGCDYLQNRFPDLEKKISFSRLGVMEQGKNPFFENVVFTIVSCSVILDNKRIYKIAELVSKMNIPIRWIHFGEGEGRSRVEEIVKLFPTGSTAELRGFTSNTMIKEFYTKECVNLFVNVSEAEGIPVSMMEAISFGIPVLATAVYGNPEIANQETGFSVPFDFNVEEVSILIKTFAQNKDEQLRIRKSAKNYFMQNFNAEKNFKEFVSIYLS